MQSGSMYDNGEGAPQDERAKEVILKGSQTSQRGIQHDTSAM